MTETNAVTAVCDDVLGTSDAVEVARLIRTGEIQASEAVDAAIARAERVNPLLNAIATPLFESARQQVQHPCAGIFAGVPSFIKDNEPVAGSPALHGSRGIPRKPAEK
ncbi:MAG: amidase family protein, partial [Myxococcales bacterium]|nr:amidase family protein [Myxococcales bacterium]